MPKKFPLFIDLTEKKVVVYGAGVIASRRVETLLAFTSSLTVFAPEASERVQRAAEEGHLVWKREPYQEGTIPADAFMVLAATSDAQVNIQIWKECKEKHILVNVCSDRELCDFQFPGIASKGDLVIGINAGGQDHRLAKTWTDKIKKEVTEDGFNNQTKTSSDISKA